MPKRVIDFDALWASDKLASCAEWAQSEYAWLYGLADASGKVGQLQVLLGAEANPQGKPVLHFMPNATPGAEAALLSNGSRGVYRDLPSLLAGLNALP